MDIAQAKNEDYLNALNMCIGENNTQRHKNATKLYIKTTQNEIDLMIASYPQYTFQEIMALTFCTEYTLEEVKVILQSWEVPSEIG